MRSETRTRAAAGRGVVLLVALALAAGCGGGGGTPPGGPDARDGGPTVPDALIVFADVRPGADAGADAGARPDGDGGAISDAGGDAAPRCVADADCAELLPNLGPCVRPRCRGGACEADPLPEGSSCDDGNACTGNGLCDADGACLEGSYVECDDDDPCTEDSCEPDGAGCVHRPRSQGFLCGDPQDGCDGSVCRDAACVWEPRPNGTPCDDGSDCDASRCRDGICVPTSEPDGTPCADDNLCTDREVCVAGTCTGMPVDCNDHDPCTRDICDRPTGACAHPPTTDGTSCDDGDPCTYGEICTTGACQNGRQVDCGDDDPCTADTCDSSTGWCAHPPGEDGVACDDHDPCTRVDSCVAGDCVGSLPPDCDDGNPCTVGRCVQGSGDCVQDPLDDGSECPPADPCLLAACAAGVCIDGEPKPCDDDNPCTADLCEAATGACRFPPLANGIDCEDGNPCTTGDTCAAGVCVGGPPPVCDDGDPCTVGRCVPETGACEHVAGNDGAACDDDAPCSSDDRCQGGACVGVWDDPFCCTSDGDCAAYDACAPGSCVDGHCVHGALACAASEDGCAAEICAEGGVCEEVTLCGALTLWRADFEEDPPEGGSGPLLVWPPGAWSRVADAAHGGEAGLRLEASRVPGTREALGPPWRIPAGTSELRLRVQLGPEGHEAPDGTLTVSVVIGGGDSTEESTVVGPTEGFVRVALTLGGDEAFDGRLRLRYDGAYGTIDVDDVHLVHLGREGCIRTHSGVLASYAAAADHVSLSPAGDGEVLVSWSESRLNLGEQLETQVNARLLAPLRARSSRRLLLSSWQIRPPHLRVRSARTGTGDVLVVYPDAESVRTVEATVFRSPDHFPPDQFDLVRDSETGWNIDGAVGGIPGGWVVVWAAPFLDGDFNSLRVQRFSTDAAPIDEEPWRGGPADYQGARGLELVGTTDGRHMVAWLTTRLEPPLHLAIVARRVNAHLPYPSLGGAILEAATQDPGGGQLSHLRLASIPGGIALGFARSSGLEGDPFQLELRRADLQGQLLPPLTAEGQVVHEAVATPDPAPTVAGLPDGGALVVWRHSLAGRVLIFYRMLGGDGVFLPAAGAAPGVLAGSGLPTAVRGAPEALLFDDEWLVVAWPTDQNTIEYRLLGLACAEGVVRCNGRRAEVCAGDHYAPLTGHGGCTAADCGAPLSCE